MLLSLRTSHPYSAAENAVQTQVLWEQARDARTLVALEEKMSLEDHRRRQTSFSELLLRHLVTGLLPAFSAYPSPLYVGVYIRTRKKGGRRQDVAYAQLY